MILNLLRRHRLEQQVYVLDRDHPGLGADAHPRGDLQPQLADDARLDGDWHVELAQRALLDRNVVELDIALENSDLLDVKVIIFLDLQMIGVEVV